MLNVITWGCKYNSRRGAIPKADLYLDCRTLPNPNHKLFMRNGLDSVVQLDIQSQISKNPKQQQKLANLISQARACAAKYPEATIGVFCIGGKHRSVFVAERIAAELRRSIQVKVSHLDIGA